MVPERLCVRSADVPTAAATSSGPHGSSARTGLLPSWGNKPRPPCGGIARTTSRAPRKYGRMFLTAAQPFSFFHRLTPPPELSPVPTATYDRRAPRARGFSRVEQIIARCLCQSLDLSASLSGFLVIAERRVRR